MFGDEKNALKMHQMYTENGAKKNEGELCVPCCVGGLAGGGVARCGVSEVWRRMRGRMSELRVRWSRPRRSVSRRASRDIQKVYRDSY